MFDPEFEIHETFDLKGSLHHRKKKAGESVGKDQDWIQAGHRLQLPGRIQRELSAQHERDAQLLQCFKMMDYSLLIGIHNKPCATDVKPGWRDAGGIVAQDGSAIYFIGIIDFSIKYSLKKQAENLLRVVEGSADKASCVSAETYAERQVRFLREKVLAMMPGGLHVGTRGRLSVKIVQANNLIAADWNRTSDPYANVKLGLVGGKTQTVLKNCNPVWNEELHLPVNDGHVNQDIEITVWDEDRVKSLRGSDDFLGRLSVPMADVLSEAVDMSNVELRDVTQGSITLRLNFQPLDSLLEDIGELTQS